MSTNTTNAAYGKAVDGDNAKTYLETTLGAALDKIDAHDHSGTTKNLAVPYGSIGAVAWTTFTPTVTQSTTVTTSTANGRYVQIGKLVIGSIDITMSGAGTGGNSIIIGALPVAAFTTSMTIGAGTYLQAGGTRYVLGLSMASTTTFGFYTHTGTGNFGVNPAVTCANTDILRATFSYEAA